MRCAETVRIFHRYEQCELNRGKHTNHRARIESSTWVGNRAKGFYRVAWLHWSTKLSEAVISGAE